MGGGGMVWDPDDGSEEERAVLTAHAGNSTLLR